MLQGKCWWQGFRLGSKQRDAVPQGLHETGHEGLVGYGTRYVLRVEAMLWDIMD